MKQWKGRKEAKERGRTKVGRKPYAYQGSVDEGDDDVRIELVIHPSFDGPDGIWVTGQLGHGHLRYFQTVTKNAERRTRTATADGIQLGRKEECGEGSRI